MREHLETLLLAERDRTQAVLHQVEREEVEHATGDADDIAMIVFGSPRPPFASDIVPFPGPFYPTLQVPVGAPYLEDGIPHTEMLLDA